MLRRGRGGGVEELGLHRRLRRERDAVLRTMSCLGTRELREGGFWRVKVRMEKSAFLEQQGDRPGRAIRAGK